MLNFLRRIKSAIIYFFTDLGPTRETDQYGQYPEQYRRDYSNDDYVALQDTSRSDDTNSSYDSNNTGNDFNGFNGGDFGGAGAGGSWDDNSTNDNTSSSNNND
jgi:uncharacterized membrane protein YgcG